MKEADVEILVVEDEELIREIFKQSLESLGFSVDTAEDGKTALEMCQSRNYDIVTTDINMPVMDGITLLKHLKSRWPFIEVIVVSGFASIENAIDALKMGAFDFILKPVNFDHLQMLVKKCYQKIAWQTESTQLKEKNLQLKELNEMKDKFLSITNHEIRTPLMIIKGYLEILESQLEGMDEDNQEVFDIIKRTTLNLSDNVERMHTLSQVSKGDWIGEESDVDITRTARDVYRNLARLFMHRNIQISLNLPQESLVVKGNEFAIGIIIRELLHNSLKYTQNDGKVELKLTDLQNEVVLNVKDNGIGIPYNKQNLIFTEFYEVQDVMNHKSSTEEFKGGGIGIGLSLVKEIVNSLKGTIQFYSEPDDGTTFIVHFPKSETVADKKKQFHAKISQ
jgi:signal transduction histidine kinase